MTDSPRSTISWTGVVLGAACGAAMLIAAFYFLPTRETVLARRVAAERPALDAQLQAVAEVLKAAEKVPVGQFNDAAIPDKDPPLNFRDAYGKPEPEWNATTIGKIEFERFHTGRPGEKDPHATNRSRPFFTTGYGYSEHFLINAADMVYTPDRYYSASRSDHADLDRTLQLRYLSIVRVVRRKDATIEGELYEPGRLVAECLIFDLKTKKLLGGFPFFADNSESIQVEYTPGVELTPGVDQAAETAATNKLADDLYKNLQKSYWQTLKEAAPSAVGEE